MKNSYLRSSSQDVLAILDCGKERRTMTDVFNDPHPFDEDPEQCIGAETKDPWDDPEQTDWPQADEEVTPDGVEGSAESA